MPSFGYFFEVYWVFLFIFRRLARLFTHLQRGMLNINNKALIYILGHTYMYLYI